MKLITIERKQRAIGRGPRMLFLLLLLLGSWQFAMAQINLTGTVTDADKMSMPGVSIAIKGTTVGTITDIDGKFAITAKEGETLVFSFIGFVSEELVVSASQPVIKMVLNPDLIGLDEVVVVGYGTQRKSDVTSAIASVKQEDFNKGAVKDIGQMLQGKVAGLSITNVSGDPADGVEILLRGVNSLKGSSEPLVLVDGIESDLSTVSPSDVESVDVLKDGSSAAIYGTRASNGVIIITTKKAKKGHVTTEYNSYYSTQKYLKKAAFYTASDYRRLNSEGYEYTDYGGSTDFLKEISRTPFTQNQNLTLSGGTEKTLYIASFNYDDREGMLLTSDYKKATARLEVTQNFFDDKAKINVGVLSSSTNSDPLNRNWAYRQALIRNPTEPVKNPDGSWEEQKDQFQYENPVALLNEAVGETKDVFTRAYGSLNINPVEGLNLKITASRDYWNRTYGYYETKKHISTVRDGLNGKAERGAEASMDNLLELTADYRKTIGDHEINALVGYSYMDHTWEKMWMYNTDFATDFYTWNNIHEGQGFQIDDAPIADLVSEKNMSKLIGGFGRLNYSYLGKYSLTASVRREGSTKFGENNKWGTFPAIQAGWTISKENFMSGVSMVNFLKLRAGYGITGALPNDPYKSKIKWDYGDYVLYNGKWIKQMVPGSNKNPNLRWEEKKEFNVGLDYTLLNNRVTGSIDYYYRYTEGLIWDYSVPVPPYLYSSIYANAGEIENKGFEIYLEGIAYESDDFKWVTSVNYSTSKMEMVTLESEEFNLPNDYIDQGYTGDPIQQSTHRIYFGGPLGDFYGYKSVDIDERGYWIIQRPDGSRVPIDSVAPEDKQVIGNGLPKHYLGWNNTFTYKNFDLSINMRGAFGYQILNFQRMFYENPTIAYNQLNTAHDKVYGKTELAYPQTFVSYYLENGNYWKIDNITLGYNYKPEETKYIQSIRVYVSGMNLLTFTKYKGIDPEVSRNPLYPGLDERDKFPTTRTFTVGLNVKF